MMFVVGVRYLKLLILGNFADVFKKSSWFADTSYKVQTSKNVQYKPMVELVTKSAELSSVAPELPFPWCSPRQVSAGGINFAKPESYLVVHFGLGGNYHLLRDVDLFSTSPKIQIPWLSLK